MAGKGSDQRPRSNQITDEEFKDRWDSIFKSPHKKHWKKNKPTKNK